MTYQPGGYGQPPFDSSTVRSSSKRKDTWVIIGTIAGVLVMLGLGAGAIYLITKKDPAPTPPAAAPQTDPLAAAAAQQFVDAVAADDPLQAMPAICSSEKASLQGTKPSGSKPRTKVSQLQVNGGTGTFTMEQTPGTPTKLTLVKEGNDWKVCGSGG
ncbi:hypothetical protein GCM10010174_75940 [Kutzneria viridogrisea]|uniref:DUF4878 domain-containing protein n=2 Tax=Kutzneria TaxID=43356 RepID=W5W599_9PSEU|nr:hypothetical protein [Kutzneria albida]AHH96403.1 hypothetical protein KALB_3035 [Kutzneria albida DSM 43870]MBA8928381.1 hypothetical protein [Kutzneria viridogrisea]